ncbi:MAG: fumarylacetoacetate hydrolase family protein [Ferruginibacter sp.]|nr:fumarylacetoacetate hydrolase family protein [Ferruginibacter sp.]
MKIFCIGRNYVAHAKELGNEVPTEPVVFMKPKSALLQSENPFFYPIFTNELHYECELVLRISKNGKNINANQALSFVDAITVGLDFTARDIQDELKKKGLPWEKAKAFDNSAVVGNFIPLTKDLKVQNIEFSLMKNNEKVQHGFSNNMIFNFADIISNISNYFTINIGDLIFTGTPAGVGECSVEDKLEGFLGNEKMFSVNIK